MLFHLVGARVPPTTDPDVRASRWYGPPPDDDCPCGSHRRATRCHRANDGSWIAEPPPPLLTDSRTGHANPGCYARASNDCDDELTREHFITDDLLDAISADGKVVVVEGAAWQAKTESRKTIGRASLSRKMLCRRDNNALSPLDKMAAEFFRYSLEDHLDIFKYLGNDDRSSFPRGFTMVSGPYIELWMLKVLWGAIEAGAISVDGQIAYRFRLGVTTRQLAEILWRGVERPNAWGLYVLLERDRDQSSIPKAIRLRVASMGTEILGGFPDRWVRVSYRLRVAACSTDVSSVRPHFLASRVPYEQLQDDRVRLARARTSDH